MPAYKKVAPAVVILAILVVPLVVAATGGGGDKGLPDLKVEQVLGGSSLMLTVANELNTRNVALNGKSVVVECVDDGGRVLARSTQSWPLQTDGGYDPHAHQLVDPEQIDAVDRCRILGTRKKLEAQPSGFVARRLGHTH